MREIGCHVFVLIQNKHNPKVFDRSLKCVLIGYDDPDAKTYRCYHRESKKVISSYHVRFLESHNGHTQPLPDTEEIPSTLNEILDNAMPTPIVPNEEEDDVLPDDISQLNNTQPILPAQNPGDDTPIRRSSHIAEKSNKPKPTCTERAVQESTDAGIRLCET